MAEQSGSFIRLSLIGRLKARIKANTITARFRIDFSESIADAADDAAAAAAL